MMRQNNTRASLSTASVPGKEIEREMQVMEEKGCYRPRPMAIVGQPL